MREVFPTLKELRIKQISEVKLVAKRDAIKVDSFESLIKEIAKLAYAHKDYLFFFRGQPFDYQNPNNSKSTFYPSIYRPETKDGRISTQKLKKRFEILESSCILLIKLFELKNIEGKNDVKQRKEIQWSILQHYEVCDTPYLDLTQSLRVACSFAVLSDKKPGETPNNGYLYVFALPYFTNRISVNSEHDLINIRLLSICPPEALRPHHQEGFLVGTTNITHDYSVKQELDFNRTLIAKFVFKNKKSFWTNDSLIIHEDVLKPHIDRVGKICQRIRNLNNENVLAKPTESFKRLWKELETLIEPMQPDKKSVKDKMVHFRSFFSIDLIDPKAINNLCAFSIKLDKGVDCSKKEILENYLLLSLQKEEIEKNTGRLLS